MKSESQYLNINAAREKVIDPDLFLRLVESGALATRIVNGKRVIHRQALDGLTADDHTQ